jgi:hypothetical protein
MDSVPEMQSKMKASDDPISCFLLLCAPSDATRALDKLKLLTKKGVTQDYYETMKHFLMTVLMNEAHDRDFHRSLLFFFRSGETDAPLPGMLKLRNVLNQGIELELVLPGAIAASVPELFENGFWTAYMPASFYR